MEHSSRFWIAVPLQEKPDEVPPEMIANTSSGAYKLVVGYGTETMLQKDVQLARKNPESTYVLLSFDTRTKVFTVLEEEKSTVAKKRR